MKKVCPFIASLLLLTQCVMVYVPNTRNVPILSKRGEVQGSGQIGVLGADFQLAGAVTNHIALMSNYACKDRGSALKFEYNFFEGGIGYFRTYEETKGSQYTTELFVGYGKGNGSHLQTNSYDGSQLGHVLVSGNYQRFFIQPSNRVSPASY
jgi:hypothetical protein